MNRPTTSFAFQIGSYADRIMAQRGRQSLRDERDRSFPVGRAGKRRVPWRPRALQPDDVRPKHDVAAGQGDRTELGRQPQRMPNSGDAFRVR